MSGSANYNFSGGQRGNRSNNPCGVAMDECSHKPLTLRQQTDKPVLKYSGTVSGTSSPVVTSSLQRPPAVPLFSHADIQYLKHTVQQYSTPPSMLNNVLFTSFIHKPPQLPCGYMQPVNNSPLSKVSVLESRIADQQPAVTLCSSLNPYAQPISAGNVQPPSDCIMSQCMAIIPSSSSTSLGSSESCSAVIPGAALPSTSSSVLYDTAVTLPSSAVIQTNFFTKPQSTVMETSEQQQYKSEKRSTHSIIDVHERKVGNVIYKPNRMLTSDEQNMAKKPSVSMVTNEDKDDTSSLKDIHGMTLQSMISNLEGNMRPTQGVAKRPVHVTINTVMKPNGENFVVTVPRPPTNAKTTASRQLQLKASSPSFNTTTSQSGGSTIGSKLNHSNMVISHGVVTNVPNHSGPKHVVGNSDISSGSSSASKQIGPNLETGTQTLSTSSTSGMADCCKIVEKVMPKSSIVRTGTANKDRPNSSGSVRPELMERVRNLNYTPVKPYSEVKMPHSEINIKKTDKFSTHVESDKVDKSNTEIRNNVVPVTQKPAIDEKPPIPGHTMYYHKKSKTEALVHYTKVRSKTDSAAAGQEVVGQNHQLGKQGTLRSTMMKAGKDRKEEEEDEWEDECEEGLQSGERAAGDGDSIDSEDEANNDVDGEDVEFENYGSDLEDNLDDNSDEGSTYFSRSGSARSQTNTSLRIHSTTKKLLGLSISKHRTSSRPNTTGSRPTTARKRPVSAVSTLSLDSDLQPALTPSLFPNIPPTINFVDVGEKVEQLPWEIRRMFKWRMSPITPNVVKNCIGRSGFRPTKNNQDWLGYWGKHMKAQGFKAVREYQKINHFPGSFQIGRKDRLWRNLSRLQVHYGKKDFGFFPQTFILPCDIKLLKRAWDEGGSKQKWIIKPPASARGIGIRVISKWNQIPRRQPVIVQRYLARPYLINDSKFDLRIYVYVTNYDPLRIYVYDDGLVRFASCKYSYAMKNLSNKYMHLTNYSINKKNNEYQSNTDEKVCQGHKWGLKALWGYMKRQGIDTNRVWQNMVDLIVKTIICSESCVNSLVKANVRRRYSCHELFGFDIMLDDQLKPWIIEVNISPSLHSNSPLDINIKGGMVKDLMNLSGYMVPDRREVTTTTSYVPEPRFQIPKEICLDKRLYPNQLSTDERAKHAYYCQRANDEFAQQTILDILTPDDLRILTETIDEGSRRGNFIRAFPNTMTYKYQRFFEAPRYYNLLLQAWIAKYGRTEARGIMVLEKLCQQGVHLENPTDNPKHQWVPPSASLRCVNSAPGTANKSGVSASSLPKLKKRVRGKQWHQGAALSGACSASSIDSPRQTPTQLHRSPPGSATGPS